MGNESSSSAGSSPHHKTNPLMDEPQRLKCLEIFKTQFTANENFLRDAVLVKLRMKGKLVKVRDRLLALKKQQQQQQLVSEIGDGHEGNSDDEKSSSASSPGTEALIKAAPVPSFANFADESSVKYKPTREEKIRDGILLLRERIQHLKVKMEVMADDGNCQFRAIAHQLYNGDQDGWHMKVRATVVAYMHKHSAEFSFLFEDEKEFNRYLGSMARERTWGDELTLKAACNAYNCVIHILTSEREHYYVCYKPDSCLSEETGDACNKKTPASTAPPPMDIFLAYISPIHYNSIRIDS